MPGGVAFLCLLRVWFGRNWSEVQAKVDTQVGTWLRRCLSLKGRAEIFSRTWRLVRNALFLLGLNYKVGLADMPDWLRCSSGLEEMAEHTFYYCERVRPLWNHVGEWMARIEPKQLVMLYVGYVEDNVLSPYQGEKRMVFLAILAVARMVIWPTRKKGLYDCANFSHCDLILFFRH